MAKKCKIFNFHFLIGCLSNKVSPIFLKVFIEDFEIKHLTFVTPDFCPENLFF